MIKRMISMLCVLLLLSATPVWAADTAHARADFFCMLNDAPAAAVQSLLYDNAHLITYDLTVYTSLSDSVRTQVDSEIACWSLMTDANTLAETDAYFTTSMDEVLNRAQIAENTMETDAWFSAVSAIGADLRFISAVNPEDVRILYGKAHLAGNIAAADIAKTLDEAQLLAVARTCHWSLLRDAYFYFEEKGVIQVPPEVHALRNQDEFFCELACVAYKATTLPMFSALVDETLHCIKESESTSYPTYGGGGSGGNSYSGGSNNRSIDLSADFDTPITGVAIAGVYSDKKLLSFHWCTMNHTTSMVWNILYSTEQNPTHIKLMTFGNDNTFCPLTPAQTFPINE